MMMSDELYIKRNALLHKATSYRGRTKKETLRVRAESFLAAEKITGQLEEYWAAQSNYPEPSYNLYDSKGRPTHFLYASDGISHRYVPISAFKFSEVRIDYLSAVQRLRKQERTVTREELEFYEAVESLYNRLAP
jgi:hypothetical protein